MEYNGFGTVPESKPAAKPAPKSPDTVRAAADAFREMERFIMEAQLAFINRQYREAETLCYQALQVDRRNATAHEILGDIFVKRGQTDNAVKAYSYAAQFNPRNLTVQAKLERLSGSPRQSAASGPTMTHPSAVSPLEQMLGGANREAALAAISGLFSALFVGLCFLLYFHPGHPFTDSVGLLSDISFNLLGAFALGGALAGSLLAMNGRMRPIQDELLAHGTLRGDEQRSPISLGIVLTGFALLWFYASLVVYIGVAVVKNRLSLSILRAYGLTALLTALFACFYQSGYHEGPGEHSVWLQAFLIGGNVAFPALLFGWAVGDALRLKR